MGGQVVNKTILIFALFSFIISFIASEALNENKLKVEELTRFKDSIISVTDSLEFEAKTEEYKIVVQKNMSALVLDFKRNNAILTR